MATILVTGGAGFIGSHIAAALVRRGDRVRILDNFSTGHRSNVEAAGEVELIEGCITDPVAVRQAVEGVDHVFHQAAMASVPLSIEEPIGNNDINVTGTLNLLLAAKEVGVKRFVYASSSAAYGDSEQLPKLESMPVAPKSPYAVAKLAGEHYVSCFAEIYGMQTLALRYFNVFGPRQDPAGPYAAVIPIFVGTLLDGRAPVIHGDGEQTRDFTHIDNVVHANLLALSAPRLGGEVVNLAMGERISLNRLYRLIASELGTDLEPTHDEPRLGDVRHSEADISRAKELLGYSSLMGVEEGLRLTVEWFRRSRQAAGGGPAGAQIVD